VFYRLFVIFVLFIVCIYSLIFCTLILSVFYVIADTESSTDVDTSQHLDLLIVEYFQSLAEIFQYKQLLENDVKDGFFYMAKVNA